MSDLPDGWKLSTIGDVADVNPRLSKSDLSDDDSVSFIPMASVSTESGHIDTSDVRPAGPLKMKSYRQFAEGDVLLAKITPSMENGKGAVARGLASCRGFGSTEFHVLRPWGVEADYLLRYVLQQSFRATAARNMTGTAGQLRVPPNYLRNHPIPVPPLAEQRRIVAAIEEHFSGLDAADAALRSGQLRLESLIQACIDSEMASAFEAPLETFASERGITDGPFGSNLKSSHYTDAGPRVVRLENIGCGEFIDAETHITREHYDRLSKHCVEPGDLLVASLYHNRLRACLAPEGLGPAIVKADCIRLRPRGSTEGKFLSYALRRSMINVWCQERVKGVGRQRLGLGGIRQLPIPNVDVDRQRAVVNRIGAIEDRTKETREIADQSLRRSAAFRRSILAAAFSGHLVPQDPSDEPASSLLQRIAAERAAASKPSRKKKRAS